MDLIKNLRTKPPTYEDAVAAADEIERLRGALSAIAISYSKDMPDGIDAKMMWIGCTHIARSAIQQKEND